LLQQESSGFSGKTYFKMQIYQPAEDSFFFSEFLKKYLSNFNKKELKKIKFLDMGTGSGILAQTAQNTGILNQNILTVDINKKVFQKLSKKFKTIQSDLFSSPKLKNQKFSLIVFNPPYLPEAKHDKKSDTTGGKTGDEIILKFLNQAKNYLKKNGKILLLISSHTPQNKIKKFKPKIVAEKKLFFEKLFIFEISF